MRCDVIGSVYQNIYVRAFRFFRENIPYLKAQKICHQKQISLFIETNSMADLDEAIGNLQIGDRVELIIVASTFMDGDFECVMAWEKEDKKTPPTSH